MPKITLQSLAADIKKLCKCCSEPHIGEVTGNNTLILDKTAISNKTAITAAGNDYILIGDTSDTDNLKKALISDFANATHTGEVTGATALTVNKIAISNKTVVDANHLDHILVGDASDADNLKKVLVSTIRPYEKAGASAGDGSTVLVAGFAGYTQVKFPTATATLVGVTVLANLVGDVKWTITKSNTFAGFPTMTSIVGVNEPELSSAQSAEIVLDGGWTTLVNNGDCFEFGISGTPDLITYSTIILYFRLN